MGKYLNILNRNSNTSLSSTTYLFGQWHTEQVDDHLPWIQFVAAPVVLSVPVIVLSISLPDIIAEMDTQRRWWWLWGRSRRRIWGWNKLYSEIVHHFISISVHAHFQWSPNFCGFINVVSLCPCCSLNWATAAHPIDDVAVPCCGYVKWVSWGEWWESLVKGVVDRWNVVDNGK